MKAVVHEVVEHVDVFQQLSLAQDGIQVLTKSICAQPRLGSFPSVAFETVPMFVWLTMALSSFQGRSMTAAFFYSSLLQAIDGMMFLALCPQASS